MPARPKVFVTRRIPAAGLDVILAHTDAEVWPGDLPPPYETLRQKVASCDGLVSLHAWLAGRFGNPSKREGLA